MKADVNADKLIHLTFFPDQWARTLTPKKMTLPALRDLILETSAPSKAALPWFKLASFGKEQSEERCLRHDANMHTISGIEIDYDGQLMSFDEAEGRLASAGLATLLYTTSSHTEAAPRWRALLPSSTELPPGERRKLVARVNGVLGGVISSESFTLSQAFFYGAVAGQPAPHVELIEGDYIDLRDDLDANAIDDNEPYSNEPLQGSPFEIARTGFVDEKVERLVAEPLQKPHRSTRFAHAVMKAVECGMTAADFEALCRENLQGCAQKYLPPERRRDELRKHIAKIWQPHERVVERDRWIAKQCEQILATAGRKAASLPFINMSNWDNGHRQRVNGPCLAKSRCGKRLCSPAKALSASPPCNCTNARHMRLPANGLVSYRCQDQRSFSMPRMIPRKFGDAWQRLCGTTASASKI